jgi:hypothetical protein
MNSDTTDQTPTGDLPLADKPTPGFWRSAFTERDNQTGDIKRLLWAVAVVWGLGLETFTVSFQHKPFDIVTFALGVSGLLAAGGGVLALNRRNENGGPE